VQKQQLDEKSRGAAVHLNRDLGFNC